MPEVNVPVSLHGRQVIADFLWRQRRFIVETDDRRTHEIRKAFESDRLRDRQLKHSGWEVVRVTWKQLTGESEALIKELRDFLTPTGRNP